MEKAGSFMSKREYQPLTIPKLAWDKGTLTESCGQVVAQPLEPGFGITLGNALRRVLLGGIEGSAVTAVIIKGINNEFSSLPGVEEDAMQVILNMKELIIRNATGKPGTMRLSVSQAGAVTAADIETDEHLEVVNTDHVLAHVAAGGQLDIEFFVQSGRGYQKAQWPIGQALQDDDRIYLDAMFSPIQRVSYDVQKTRVGKNIDYDKLILTIETDGSENPVAALNYAVSVLRTQLEHFLVDPEIPFNEISTVPEEQQTIVETVGQKELVVHGLPVDLLLKPIDVLEFSVRAHNCLLNAGITQIVDLVNMTEDELQKIKNFGRKSFEEVKEGLKEAGLSLGMDVKESDLIKMQEKQS